MSSSPQPRQTLSYIHDLLRSRGLRPKNKLGQNFLVDLNLLEVVVQSAELTTDDCVLEVGTGTGALSSRIADQAGALFTVELDADFFRLARSILAVRENVLQFHGDILERKNEVNPLVLEGWLQLQREKNLKRLKLVANLPYAIATPLIANLLIAEVPLERIVVMVQLEVAQRFIATVGTKDYGALAILSQSVADTEILRKIPPTAFWPRPKVDSAIIQIRPNAEKRAQVGNILAFRHFLRDLYTQRRKSLRQALVGWPGGKRDKAHVDAVLAELGISGTERSEMLDIPTHLRLAAAFAKEPNQNNAD